MRDAGAEMGASDRPVKAPFGLDHRHSPCKTVTYEWAAATLGGSANIRSGLPSLVIVDSSTTTRDRLDSDGRSYITSSSDLLEDRAQAAGAGLARQRLAGDRAQRGLADLELDAFHAEHLLVLLDERVLGLDQDLDQRRLVELVERRRDRQAADELGNQAELDQVLGLRVAQEQRRCSCGRRGSPLRRRSRCPSSRCAGG